MGERVIVGGHAIDRGHGAQGAGIIIGPPVAHHAHGADRQDGDEGLPDVVVKPVLADLVDVDGVGLRAGCRALARDLARAADGKAGAGEGVAPDETLRQAKFAAKRADLVLEQLAQRFDQFQPHLFRQAADIVVDLIVTDGPPEKLNASMTSG